jgi:hypothetical protein
MRTVIGGLDMVQVGQKVIVTFRGSQEFTGVLSVINDKVIVLELGNGTITFDRADVELKPVEELKPVKKGRKPKAKKETEQTEGAE